MQSGEFVFCDLLDILSFTEAIFPPAKIMYEIQSQVVTGDAFKMAGVNHAFWLSTCVQITQDGC